MSSIHLNKRYSRVCYTDLSVATIPTLGKPEDFIGRLKSDDAETFVPDNQQIDQNLNLPITDFL
jgi:hypothetical protein